MAVRVEIREKADAPHVVKLVGKFREEFGTEYVTQGRAYTGPDGFMVTVYVGDEAEARKVRTIAKWWAELKTEFRMKGGASRGVRILIKRGKNVTEFGWVFPRTW